MSTALDRLRAKGLAGAPAPVPPQGLPVCSCGCTEPHVIMNRETFDGVRVALWSDGSITTVRLGTYIPGLGEPRSAWGRRTRVAAVRLIADDIAIFTVAELPVVVKVAERTFAYNYSSDTDQRGHAIAIARRTLATKGAVSS